MIWFSAVAVVSAIVLAFASAVVLVVLDLSPAVAVVFTAGVVSIFAVTAIDSGFLLLPAALVAVLLLGDLFSCCRCRFRPRCCRILLSILPLLPISFLVYWCLPVF